MSRRFLLAALVVLVSVLVAGCGGGSSESSGETDKSSGAKQKVTLQLKWVTQAQFAGYYAAKAKGYYDEEGLDVNIKIGGPSITPEQVVLGKQAEFGIDWLPSLLAARDTGQNLVNIAQVFGKSGMTELTWKDSNITSIGQMRGKKVGVWCCGNEPELYAALTKNGIDPKNKNHVTIVNQPFTMDLFLNREVDAAAAMTYNELAQVLETKNPKTGKLYQPSDINVIKMDDAGTGMLEDGLFSTEKYLSNPTNQTTAVKVIAATLQGWIYCRDHQAECVQMTLKEGPTLPKGHQTWQMNEINKLIWPNATGIGIMNTGDYARTAAISKQFGVIKKAPTAGAYRTDLAKRAVALLKAKGLDVNGLNWKPENVTLTAGGK